MINSQAFNRLNFSALIHRLMANAASRTNKNFRLLKFYPLCIDQYDAYKTIHTNTYESNFLLIRQNSGRNVLHHPITRIFVSFNCLPTIGSNVLKHSNLLHSCLLLSLSAVCQTKKKERKDNPLNNHPSIVMFQIYARISRHLLTPLTSKWEVRQNFDVIRRRDTLLPKLPTG